MFGVSATILGNNDNNNNNTITSVRAADGGTMVAAEAQESGGTSGGSCSDAAPVGLFLSEEGDKTGGGGNRWPRQETLALLKIRSEMDLAFRDSSLKGPLWENVSRKMAEIGYQRNAKKCKEKFENVYKYHKRTKEGRSSKTDGKTYRFFDQLQALENIGGAPPPQPPSSSVQLPPPARPSPQTMPAAVTMAVPIQVVQATPSPTQVLSPHQHNQLTVSSTPQNTNTVSFNNPFTSQSPHQPPQPPAEVDGNAVVPPSFLSNSPSLSSSSTSSDEDIEKRQKRKRKYKDLLESLMQTVVEKQEAFQKKFLKTLEKRENVRMIREEAWRVQEMARLKNEQDLLVQERSMAAARESALISLLQKIYENQQNPKNLNDTIAISFGAAVVQLPEKPLPPTPIPTPPPAPDVVKQSTPPPPSPSPHHVLEPPQLLTPVNNAPQPIRVVENLPRQDNNGGGSETYNTSSSATSSRWPKPEIDALINLRTHLDNKYQENGPKGPLWEEISGEMKKIGYNRNAKRCKEKWENINKYFKKVKESCKKRPEDSKTCPYFHQLDALYREKEKSGKPENPMMPVMARPEQQWPFPQEQQKQKQQQQQQQQKQLQAMEEREGENNDEEYDDEDDDGDEEEEDEGSAYEIVSNKQPSSVTSTAA